MCDNCGCGKMAETFRAPYAGSDALSSIDFSKAQITNIIGTGDFDHASLNSSGHQNIFANAEEFAAASTARADLPREKRNVLSSVRANYDPSFSWSSCSWGPYFNRFAAEGSNKFYSVWVWERSPGIYTAMGAYGGLGQNPRLFNVGQTRDLQQAVNMAKKKLQSKQKKGYQTYSAEYISSLSNGIVQFEDGSGFSSASAPPNDIFLSEEGNAPVQDPMELGEMANWTPMAGSEGLKRKRAESEVFALTYYLQNDVNMEDITDISQALQLYLSLSEDIAEMDASGLQKHPRYEVANRMLSDLSYRLDDLHTQLPDIDVDIEMDAEYDAWRSAFTDGAAATQIHKYDRNWMQKVMNPKSRQVKAMWGDAEPDFMQELKSAEEFPVSSFYHQPFLQRITPLTWGLGIGGAFFLGKKL